MPIGVYPRSDALIKEIIARLPHKRINPLERLLAKVRVQANGCWLWSGCLARPQGYARLKIDGKAQYAHIFAYEYLWGPIPPGKEIDHLCRNRACVNPFHLEAVTRQLNCLRGYSPAAVGHRKAKNRLHCIHGHPWTPENTYYRIIANQEERCAVPAIENKKE